MGSVDCSPSSPRGWSPQVVAAIAAVGREAPSRADRDPRRTRSSSSRSFDQLAFRSAPGDFRGRHRRLLVRRWRRWISATRRSTRRRDPPQADDLRRRPDRRPRVLVESVATTSWWWRVASRTPARPRIGPTTRPAATRGRRRIRCASCHQIIGLPAGAEQAKCSSPPQAGDGKDAADLTAWCPADNASEPESRRAATLGAMDLHVIGPLASPAERAAVDAVLGPPEQRLARRRARPADRRPRRARRPRGAVPARPAAPGPPRDPGPGRLDQPAGAELHLPAADGPAGRGVRRGDVLRAVRDDSPGRRPSPTSATTSPAGSPARRSSAPTSSGRSGPRAAPARDGRTTWLRSPCLGLCERAPAAMFTIAGETAPRSSRRRSRRRRRASSTPARGPDAARTDRRPRTDAAALRSPQVGRAGAPAPRAGRRRRSRRRSTTTAPRRLRAPCERARRDRPAAGHRRGHRLAGSSAAAAPRSRPAASGRPSRPSRPSRTTSSATPTSRSPGTFKDRVLMEGDPFAVVESMTIEGFATGASKGYLYIRGEYPLAEARIRGAIDAARAAGYLGPRSGSDFASTSSSGAAPAPTSAARRRRSSSRSRASAASRATSRRSRSRSGCSASRPRSTTSRRSSTCC